MVTASTSVAPSRSSRIPGCNANHGSTLICPLCTRPTILLAATIYWLGQTVLVKLTGESTADHESVSVLFCPERERISTKGVIVPVPPKTSWIRKVCEQAEGTVWGVNGKTIDHVVLYTTPGWAITVRSVTLYCSAGIVVSIDRQEPSRFLCKLVLTAIVSKVV